MTERWRQIYWAPDYDVSDDGRVRNRYGRVLKTTPNNKTGKPQVTLTVDGERTTRSVSRLMEEAFGW